MADLKFETPLCEIAFKYGTDKCPQIRHSYTPFYYGLFRNRRETVAKVLELGIGCPARMVEVPGYRTGASLYMWREFFPNAQIYGADIEPETMFKDERIETLLCDETKAGDLEALIGKTGSDIDLVVDDAIHARRPQIFAALTLMPLLNRKIIYVIEDVRHPDKVLRLLAHAGYDVQLIPEAPGNRSDNLIMVRHRL